MTLLTTDSDEKFIQAARDQFEDEGTLEIDDGAVVSRGEDAGHYVQAWVWVQASFPDGQGDES